MAPDPERNRLFYHPPRSNLHPNYFSILRQPSFAEVHSVIFSNLLPNTGIFHGFDYMQDINALAKEPYIVFLRYVNQIDAEKRFRLLGALNVNYVVSFRPLDGEGIALVRHFAEYPSWLYKIDRVVPRAYVVQKTRQEDNPQKVLEYLSSEWFNPNLEAILSERLPIARDGEFEGNAKILDYVNQRVTISASLNGSGVLVLADSFYPGWRVYVDGKEEKMLKANYFFRAVALTKGEHIVEFRYEPYGFKVGLILSLATFLSVAVVSVVLFTRTPQDAGSSA